METCNNLLRDSIHPQGVGRWVPGGDAATLPLAACAVLEIRGCEAVGIKHIPVPVLRAPCSRAARYYFYQVSSDCHVI